MKRFTFSFSGELFEGAVEATWVFLALPSDQAQEIRDLIPRRPGFGSVKVMALIGASEWSTSIFPSKEIDSYVLPIKRSIRDAERIDAGDLVEVSIRLFATGIA